MPDTSVDHEERSLRARIAVLERDIAEIRKLAAAAEKKSGPTQASAAYRRESRILRQEKQELEDRRTALLTAPGDLTPEQRLDRVREMAPRMTDDEQDVVVRDWLSRRKYELEVDEGGTLALHRIGDGRLRVVGG